MTRRATPILAVSVAMFVPCIERSPNPADDRDRELIAARDPMFGGGASTVLRLLSDPLLVTTADDGRRAVFVERERATADVEARGLVQETVDAEHASAIATFLGSEAGGALTRAERLALTFRAQPDDFPRRTTARFGDAEQVGDHAKKRFVEVQTEIADGASASPGALSLLTGAMSVTTAHAEAIHAFGETPAGRHWIDARTAAFVSTQARYTMIATRGIEQGWLANAGPELPDLLLPGTGKDKSPPR